MIFLVQTPHPWRGIRQRPHHVMSQFALRGHRVEWVESRYLRWLLGRTRDFRRARLESPLPGLTVRPVTLMNGERFARVRRWNEERLARAFAAGAASWRADQPRILWIYYPHEVHLADRVPHDLLVYDIMDEYQGFPWAPRRIAEEEGLLLARADWVFAGTRALFDAKCAAAEGRIECLLSGVDAERFARRDKPSPRADKTMAALRARYKRLVGYAGMIDLRIDQDAILEAARRLPRWGFVLVGPLAADVEKLRRAPNVHFIGARPYETLPGCYHSWDAAMLPFIDHPVTRHSNPTKMLEYAAAGLPIVARGLPEIVGCYGDGTWLYDTPESFVTQVQQAVGGDENNPAGEAAPGRAAKLTAMQGWMRERGWDAIAGRMISRIETLLAAKKRGGR